MAIPRRYATGGDNLARKTEKDDGRKKMGKFTLQPLSHPGLAHS